MLEKRETLSFHFVYFSFIVFVAPEFLWRTRPNGIRNVLHRFLLSIHIPTAINFTPNNKMIQFRTIFIIIEELFISRALGSLVVILFFRHRRAPHRVAHHSTGGSSNMLLRTAHRTHERNEKCNKKTRQHADTSGINTSDGTSVVIYFYSERLHQRETHWLAAIKLFPCALSLDIVYLFVRLQFAHVAPSLSHRRQRKRVIFTEQQQEQRWGFGASQFRIYFSNL